MSIIVMCIFQNCTNEEESIDSLSKTNIIKYNDSLIFVNNIITIYNPYKEIGELKLKGSMHVHTDNSAQVDGYPSGNPRWVAEKLRDEGGYDFYTFTDHNYITPDPQIGGIVWMGLSVEDTSTNAHVAAYNLPSTRFVSTKDNISDKVNYYSTLGAYTNLCHPNWHGTFITKQIINNANLTNFVEVMNSYEKRENHRVLDYVRNKNKVVFGFGVDDFHYDSNWVNPNSLFNKAWIVALVDSKEKYDIWQSLLRGSFFVTNGPNIDIKFDQNSLYVYSDIKSDITFFGGTKAGETIKLDIINNVFEASYSFSNDLIWLRAEVNNIKGLAHTQAIQVIGN